MAKFGAFILYACMSENLMASQINGRRRGIANDGGHVAAVVSIARANMKFSARNKTDTRNRHRNENDRRENGATYDAGKAPVRPSNEPCSQPVSQSDARPHHVIFV